MPVIWMSNKKKKNDWFKTHFCREIEKYCKTNNLSYRALLVINNAPGHSISFNNMGENIKVEFLPPNTTALTQPMDQSVIAAFKKILFTTKFE